MLRHVARARGSTLLEVVVGAALIAFALVASLESVESVGRMNELHRQQRRALEVAESKLADLRALPFANVVATIAASTTLSSFSVPDLPSRRKPGVAPTAQGSVQCWTDETQVPAELGGPMDLNANGNATDTNATATLKILPVRVTVTWGTRGSGNAETGVTVWAILNAGDAP